jgi:hypothetical protein
MSFHSLLSCSIQQRLCNGLIPYLWPSVCISIAQNTTVLRQLERSTRILTVINVLYILQFEYLYFFLTSPSGLLRTVSRKNHLFHVAAKRISYIRSHRCRNLRTKFLWSEPQHQATQKCTTIPNEPFLMPSTKACPAITSYRLLLPSTLAEGLRNTWGRGGIQAAVRHGQWDCRTASRNSHSVVVLVVIVSVTALENRWVASTACLWSRRLALLTDMRVSLLPRLKKGGFASLFREQVSRLATRVLFPNKASCPLFFYCSWPWYALPSGCIF